YVFSFSTVPVANNDTYNLGIIGNVGIDTATGPAGSVFKVTANDQGSNLMPQLVSANSAQGGNVVLRSDGTFTYDPPVGYTGTDTFTYTVTNGNGTSPVATVTLTV